MTKTIFNPFLHLSIRNRLIVGFGFLIALLVFASSYFLYEMTNINKSQADIFAAMKSIEHSEEDEHKIVQAELRGLHWVQPVLKEKAALFEYVLSDDEDHQQALFAEFNTLGKEIVKIGEEIKPLIDDEELIKQVGKIQAVQNEIRSAAINVIAAYDGEGEYGEETVVMMKEFSSQLENLLKEISGFQGLVTGIVSKVNADISIAIHDSNEQVANSVMVTEKSSAIVMVFLAVAIVLAVVISLLIYQSITQPLSSATELARCIAKYDLSGHDSQQSNSKGKDEISVLMGDLFDMRKSLRDLVGQIKNMGGTLSGFANELNDTSEKIGSATSEQMNKSNESVEIANHLLSSADSMAIHASDAAKFAVEADDLVKKCVNEDVANTTSAMEEVRSEMDTTRDRINGLSDSADKIGEIVTVITGIAEQTNLLALNASIESARAGEQGRGFAVVADEVRTLAARTSEATSTISEMVTTVQTQVQDASHSMEASDQSVQNSIEAVSNIVKSLHAIEDSNDRLKTDNELVSSGAGEQKSSADQISNNIQSAGTSTTKVFDHAKNIGGQAKSLKDIVTEMNEAVAQFSI